MFKYNCLIIPLFLFLKGGMSKRYKKFIAEKGITDETYDGIKTALFRVQGTSPQNMQAIEVDLVSLIKKKMLDHLIYLIMTPLISLVLVVQFMIYLMMAF